jgi:UDP-N-acetylmuramoylalanine--D-glutamate ligase
VACIGATKQAFSSIAAQEDIPYIETDNLSDAVTWLYDQRNDGDVLMLSPGCASFGIFHDYLDRANQFRSCIQKLPE